MAKRQGRGRKHLVGLGALLGAMALVSGACTNPPSDPDQPDPEILELLNDPDFVASLGETEAERADALASLSQWAGEAGSQPADLAVLQQNEANRQKHLDAIAAEEAAEAELAIEQAQAEAKRLEELQVGPEVEDLQSDRPDPADKYDFDSGPEHWESLPGFSEQLLAAEARYFDIQKVVRAEIASYINEGVFYDLIKDPTWQPPGHEDDALYEAVWAEEVRTHLPPTGACKDRAGGRPAPKPGLRPGTIYTPEMNSFSDVDGTPDYIGDVRASNLDGEPILIVEGHIGNLDEIGISAGQDIRAHLQTRVNILLPDGFESSAYLRPWTLGTPIEVGEVKVMCYTNDYNLATGQPIRRAMFQAFVPWNMEGKIAGVGPFVDASITDPLFQVKATVHDPLQAIFGWVPQLFYGADMVTAHLGQEPLAHNKTFTNGGFGVSVGRGVIYDDNGVTGDDLESTLRGPLSSGITSALSGLDGTSDWVWGKTGGSWGWVGFHINNSNPTTPAVDIQWDPTKYAGANDDEYRLKGTIGMDDWLVEGYASTPFALLGLVPCYFRFKVDFNASVYASIDINDTARTILEPNIEIAPLSLNIHSMFAQPLPLGCNSLYAFHWLNKIDDKINAQLPQVNEDLAEEIEVQPNVQNAVPASIPLGGGDVMQALFAGWNNTCVPYGCNGGGAGDMAMSWAGLEATGDFRFTDDLGPWVSRRFPVSYSPPTNDTANGRVRQHFGPQNWITDFGAWVNPSVLNQMLRVVAEYGKLDLNLDPGTPGLARSSPVYLSKPVADDKPIALFLPHLELRQGGNTNIFAMDAYAAIGVGFDPATRKLVPAPVSPADPGLRIRVNTLKCDSPLYAVCVDVVGLVDDVVNWVGNTLLNPMLESSIGQVTIPNTGGFSLSGFEVLNEDGHLGFRSSVGAPQLRAWGGIDAAAYGFDTFHEGLGGTGDVTYAWTVRDMVSNTIVFNYTGTAHQFTGLDATSLTTFDPGFGPAFKIVKATIVATRGGQSISTEHTLQLVV
ncbi:MAG: hypothetical protein GY812_11185 [Actinomycetia bacterium]|nr:hypothetical protein [Actinomycetes bacterium]